MKKINFFFFILSFFIILINSLKASEKVSYIDIDYLLANSIAGKSLLSKLQIEEKIKVDIFKSEDENFKKKESKILAKKNLITKEEITKELKLLQIEFNKYRKKKQSEINDLKNRRNKNIMNFLNLINPIIEKYMADNSVYMIIDKKNVFIASKEYDITNNLIELINNQIKNIEIK